MFDDESINLAFGGVKNDQPPENSSATTVSENYEKIMGWLLLKPIRGIKKWE